MQQAWTHLLAGLAGHAPAEQCATLSRCTVSHVCLRSLHGPASTVEQSLLGTCLLHESAMLRGLPGVLLPESALAEAVNLFEEPSNESHQVGTKLADANFFVMWAPLYVVALVIED